MASVYEARFNNALRIAKRIMTHMGSNLMITWEDKVITGVWVHISAPDNPEPSSITFNLQRTGEEDAPVEGDGQVTFFGWEKEQLMTIDEFNSHARLKLCVWAPVHGFHRLLGLEVPQKKAS